MAGGRERGRQKSQGGTGQPGTPQLHRAMRRTGVRAAGANRAGPASAAQMNPGAERGGKPDIPGDDEDQPANAADAGDIPPDGRPVGMVVVAQHHPSQAARKAADGGKRVRQAVRVGEQPQRGQPAAEPGAGPPRPSVQAGLLEQALGCRHGISAAQPARSVKGESPRHVAPASCGSALTPATAGHARHSPNSLPAGNSLREGGGCGLAMSAGLPAP
jgi:hypothetical protein